MTDLKTGILLCVVLLACSCREQAEPSSEMAQGVGFPYLVAYVHAGHLVVKDDPAGPSWIYYTFTARANRFPYAIDSHGAHIAYARGEKLEGERAESIEVLSLETRRRERLEGFEVQSLAFSPDASRIAFLGVEGTMSHGWRRQGLFLWQQKGSGTFSVLFLPPFPFDNKDNYLNVGWPPGL